jgi:hypothetical protein
MAGMDQKWHVTFEAREFDVSTDQRDWAAMEAQDFPGTSKILPARYMCWNAACRVGLYNGSWNSWNDRDCLSVQSLMGDDETDDDDPEPDDSGTAGAETGDEQRLDPGPTTPPAASTSPSAAKRASRSRKS